MAVPDAIAIMLQVLDALTSAHEQGVIHQDIKPGNIMLTAEKRVKVGDFGISRLMNVETTTIFSTIGTPSYMSPEQCRGDDSSTVGPISFRPAPRCSRWSPANGPFRAAT